jgi:hypothetical protein
LVTLYTKIIYFSRALPDYLDHKVINMFLGSDKKPNLYSSYPWRDSADMGAKLRQLAKILPIPKS